MDYLYHTSQIITLLVITLISFHCIYCVTTTVVLKIGLMGPRHQPSNPNNQSPPSQPRRANGIEKDSKEKSKS